MGYRFKYKNHHKLRSIHCTYLFNKLGRILNIPLSLNANYGEYAELIRSSHQKTGITIVDLIDLQAKWISIQLLIKYMVIQTLNTLERVIEILRRDGVSDSVIFLGKLLFRYLLIKDLCEKKSELM